MCFDEQLRHKYCFSFQFPVVWSADSYSCSFWSEIYLKSILWKKSWFPTLKTKQFPYAATVCRALILLTLLPAYMRRVCANTSSLCVIWSSKGLPGLIKVAPTFLWAKFKKNAKFIFSCASASNTVIAIWNSQSTVARIWNLTCCPRFPESPAINVDSNIRWAWS